MAYFDCIVGGSGKGNTLVVTCADELAGATITCTNGTKTYTKTCPSTAPYEVTFYGLAAGTYTVSATVSGNTYTTTVVVVDCAALLGGFNWRTWVDTAQFLDSSDYDSLDEVLADELAIRELCLEHACVDYLADIATTSADVETIIENDLFAKWVNNSNYSLDVLGANTTIKTLMDTADKYGYGEWALVGQVPKMTSNTAPYGEVIYSTQNSSYPAFNVFDSSDSTTWATSSYSYPVYIGYKFTSPVCIKRVTYVTATNGGHSKTKDYIVQGSNTGSSDDWVDILSGRQDDTSVPTRIILDLPNNNSYLYYRLYFTSGYHEGSNVGINELQFYAWQPKGNVPVMTSNTAPYGEASLGGTVSNPAYIAFNGDVINSCVASGAQSLTYKFTNPVNVKRIKWIPYQADGSQTFKAHTVTFYGSNDNSTWTTLGSKEVAVTDKTNELTLDIPNNTDYFLYYKATPNQANAGNYTVFCSLQYYGRELSVSVPVMTTNTTPYGLAGATIESNVQAWNAFKGFSDSSSARSGWWYVSDTAPQSFFYEFPTPMVIKGFKYENGYQGATQYAVRSSLYGSNDGGITYEKIIDVTGTSGPNVKFYFPIENAENKAYKRYKVEGVSAINWGIYSNVNFYGLDYSEKEFEEGTTKKWLYDHGVELETIDVLIGTGGSVTKNPSCITCKGGGTEIVNRSGAGTRLDLTPYSLAFTRLTSPIGGNNTNFAVTRDSLTVEAIASISTTPPLNEVVKSIDVSSINQTYYLTNMTYDSANAMTSFKELWLE